MPGIPKITAYSMPDASDLPPNIAGWTVQPHRAVLLVHDMQRFFLRPFPPGCRPVTDLLHNAASLRDHAAKLGVPVAYTAQPGGMTAKQRGLLKDFWGPGMTPAPADRQVVDELTPAHDDWILTKWRYSAFHRSDLLERMRGSGRDQLIVCGVYAHVGILMTLVDAFTEDIQAFLPADAVADFSIRYHRMAVTYAAERCAVVATTAQILEEMS